MESILHLTDFIMIGKLSSLVSTNSHIPFGLSIFESLELLFNIELAFSLLFDTLKDQPLGPKLIFK